MSSSLVFCTFRLKTNWFSFPLTSTFFSRNTDHRWRWHCLTLKSFDRDVTATFTQNRSMPSSTLDTVWGSFREMTHWHASSQTRWAPLRYCCYCFSAQFSELNELTLFLPLEYTQRCFCPGKIYSIITVNVDSPTFLCYLKCDLWTCSWPYFCLLQKFLNCSQTNHLGYNTLYETYSSKWTLKSEGKTGPSQLYFHHKKVQRTLCDCALISSPINLVAHFLSHSHK